MFHLESTVVRILGKVGVRQIGAITERDIKLIDLCT